MQVVVADLCGGTPAAQLLGATGPGVHSVTVNDTELVVAIPEHDDVVPVGPLRPLLLGEAPGPLAAAYASADLLLTLVPLDPSLGGDHLATWATGAVAMVTAGQSIGDADPCSRRDDPARPDPADLRRARRGG